MFGLVILSRAELPPTIPNDTCNKTQTSRRLHSILPRQSSFMPTDMRFYTAAASAKQERAGASKWKGVLSGVTSRSCPFPCLWGLEIFSNSQLFKLVLFTVS